MTGFFYRPILPTFTGGIYPTGEFFCQDYASYCEHEKITIPEGSRRFGFIIDQGDTPEEVESLFKALKRNNLSALVVQFGTVYEWRFAESKGEQHWSKIEEKVKAFEDIFAKFGFVQHEQFNSSYEDRKVYVGNTADGAEVKKRGIIWSV